MRRTILAATLIAVVPAAATKNWALHSPHAQTALQIEGASETEEGTPVAFAVRADPAPGEVVTYSWDFDDGSTGVSGPGEDAVNHRFAQDGSYEVGVAAEGDRGFVGRAERTVVVRNVPPEIRTFTADDNGLVDELLSFSALAEDAGTDTLTYTWSFGDGSPVESGVDLRVVRHSYAEAGQYRLTLTVEDGPTGESGRVEVSRVVTVATGFQARVKDEDGLMEMDGYISSLGMIAGGLPSQMPYVDAAVRQCLLTMIAWDDRNRAFVVFTGMPTPYRRARYEVGRQPTEVTFSAQMVAHLPNRAYEDVKALLQGGMDPAELAARVLANPLMARVFGGGDAPRDDSQRAFGSTSGWFVIDQFDEDRVHARFAMTLMDDPGRAGEQRFRGMVGRLAWKLDDPSRRQQLLFCGRAPFELQEHAPGADERNVDFRRPGISVSFTHPHDTASVTDESFQVGYLDESEQFHPIDGVVSHGAPAEAGGAGVGPAAPGVRTIHFTPRWPLVDGVYYEVRVLGGATGIRGVNGVALAEDYAWRFATGPDLVQSKRTLGPGSPSGTPPSGAAGPTGLRPKAPPESRPDIAVSRASLTSVLGRPLAWLGRTGGGNLASRTAWIGGPLGGTTFPVQERAVSQNDEVEHCPTPWDQLTKETEPRLELHVFQTTCDPPLIPDKPALLRVLAHWPSRGAMHLAVEDLEAEITITDKAKRVVGRGTFTFKRPDLWSVNERRTATTSWHSAWTPRGSVASPLTVTVVPRDKRREDMFYPASRATRLTTRTPDLGLTNVVFFVGDWEDGTRDFGLSGLMRKAARGNAFAAEALPLTRIAPSDWTAASPKEPCGGTRVARPAGRLRKMVFECTWREDGRVFDIRVEDWLMKETAKVAGPNGARLALVPDGYANPVGSWRARVWPSGSDLENRLLIVNDRLSAPVVAHEFMHYFGLSGHVCANLSRLDEVQDWLGFGSEYCPERNTVLAQQLVGSGCRGASIAGGIHGIRLHGKKATNKSSDDGNGSACKLNDLRQPGTGGDIEIDEAWPNDRDYRQLVRNIAREIEDRTPTWRTPTERQGDPARESEAASLFDPSSWYQPRTLLQPQRLRSLGAPLLTSRQAYVHAPTPQVTEASLVGGWLVPDGARGIIDAVSALPDGISGRTPSGEYRLELVDGTGAVVGSTPFGPMAAAPPLDGDTSRVLPFLVETVIGPAVQQLVLKNGGGETLDRIEASASTPTLQITDVRSTADRVNLSWIGSDADGDLLTYDVFYTAEGESAWRLVASGLTDTSVALPTLLLRRGPSPTFRVDASDGFHRKTALAAAGLPPTFSVLSHGPSRDTVDAAQPTVFARFNSDLEPEVASQGSLILRDAGGRTVPAEVDYDVASRTLWLVPIGPLESGARFTATVAAGTLDRHGNRLAEDVAWSFHTAPDGTPPTVAAVWPPRWSVSADPGTTVRVRFSEPLDGSSVDGSALAVRQDRGATVSGQVSYDEATGEAVFSPGEALQPSTRYVATVSARVRDRAGNALQEDESWSFRTLGAVRPVGWDTLPVIDDSLLVMPELPEPPEVVAEEAPAPDAAEPLGLGDAVTEGLSLQLTAVPGAGAPIVRAASQRVSGVLSAETIGLGQRGYAVGIDEGTLHAACPSLPDLEAAGGGPVRSAEMSLAFDGGERHAEVVLNVDNKFLLRLFGDGDQVRRDDAGRESRVVIRDGTVAFLSMTSAEQVECEGALDLQLTVSVSPPS